MFWCDKIAERIPDELQIINDSKTPSGQVHVGSLRGVLIHDAVFRALRERDIPCEYRFGVDDYDPVDELPDGHGDHFEPYLGVPLCNAPPPPGSSASDMAEHYISEFFEIFEELGVKVETYRMRDIYRSGKFNEAIDRILRSKDAVRDIYRRVSKSERPEDWYPFQVICENCGKIGTTQVIAYDGKEVEYKCLPDLVRWASGCGNTGKISPFDGNGKLPWKLEWVAKWREFPVTIEGAGKDHSTKGGSRDVAAACLRAIFDQKPPLNIPYEFFLVDGAKMSSSKGLGVTARSMTDFLPAELLRFLMLRSQPNRPVNFSPEEKQVIKVFNDYDRYHTRYYQAENVPDEDKRVYELSQIGEYQESYAANFQLVVTLVQMPHLDLTAQIEKHKGSPLSDFEKARLNDRIQAANYWVDNFATEDERTRLQHEMPDSANALTATQRAFLHIAAEQLSKAEWEDDSIQSALFEAARRTPIAQGKAFQSMYRVLLDRDAGPKAGNLIAVLERQFVVDRFRGLDYSVVEFIKEVGLSQAEFDRWLEQQDESIATASVTEQLVPTGNGDLRVLEFLITATDGKVKMQRVLLYHSEDGGQVERRDHADFLDEAGRYLDQLRELYRIPIDGIRKSAE